MTGRVLALSTASRASGDRAARLRGVNFPVIVAADSARHIVLFLLVNLVIRSFAYLARQKRHAITRPSRGLITPPFGTTMMPPRM